MLPELKLNMIPSPKDERDWKVRSNLISIELPKKLDYRKYLLPVRDQGSQGACVAVAASTMKEYQEFRDDLMWEYFSPQFIYDNRTNKDSGMYLRDLMRILQKIGCVTEDKYPYLKKTNQGEGLIKEASNFRIANYALCETIEDVKCSLVTNGIVLIAVPVFNHGERMWKRISDSDQQQGGHCMAIVGYDEKGFIIRNSWGKDWNGNGYTVFPYEDWGCQWEIWTTVDDNSYRSNYVYKDFWFPLRKLRAVFRRFISDFKRNPMDIVTRIFPYLVLVLSAVAFTVSVISKGLR